MINEDTILSPEELLQLRGQLDRELAVIERELENLQAGLETVKLDQTSVGRLSRMDALQQQAMSSGMRERILFRLRRVRAAVDRIEGNAYGRCCECDVALSLQRLRADAASPFCADCQEEIDLRRRSR